MNVLIVEDEPEHARRLKRYLRRIYTDVTLVGPYDDFESILPHVRGNDSHVDLALVDIQLKGLADAGVYVAHTLQEVLDIPVLFVSGSTDDRTIERAESVKNARFLQKPFDADSFQRAIEGILAPRTKQNDRSSCLRIVYWPESKDKLWIKTENSTYHVTEVIDILAVEAMGHYCRINIKGQEERLTVKANLRADFVDDILAGHGQFIEVKRGLLINREHIRRVDSLIIHIDGVILTDNRPILIAKDRKKEVYELLGLKHLLSGHTR